MTPGRGRIADLDWIHALYELGQKAANGAHPQQVRQEILEHIVRGFDAESGSIALIVDGTTDQLELAAGTDLPLGLIGNPLPRGTGVFGHVVETGQPVLVNGDAAETGLPLRGSVDRQRSTHSAMCWPLRVAGRTIGAVAVNRAETSPRYTADDLDQGQALMSLLALVMANHRMHVERENRILELSTLNATMQRINGMLEDAQNQVIQSEKLASIGQMAAGVAHEINNPLAFALSNLGSLEAYLTKIFELLAAYIDADVALGSTNIPALAAARMLRDDTDFEFLRRDTADLVSESRDGLLRVKRIVQDLRDFSRGGVEEVLQAIDVHAALDRTLNIVRNELKYKANIVRNYGTLPEIECMPSRLNQVFLNLLVNAGQSIDGNGTITISTGVDDDAWISVADTGCGIAPENLNRIFDPFFTTKPVGQGTGLGLSVSHSIVRKHGGRIDVESEVGRGTCFTVRLPLVQANASLASEAEKRAA
ncbi:MAG TPA: ATP-binding protein [Casimicrobiaceae bacterium]|jgi:signal transduction histidine kinase|nr:ATP-binding protein [Casimicrobiaceae bacterium]HXU66484.1 ATP-binding protein [Casimicrobiaceae bacterium]